MKRHFLVLGVCLGLGWIACDRRAEAETSQHQCREISAVLDTAAQAEAALACEGAQLAAQVLARCGFHARRPLRFGVVSVVYDFNGARQLGDYLPNLDRIRILSKAAFRQLAKPVFADVPVSEADYYRSVAAHEAAHAIFHPHTAHLDLPINAQEYVAYVIQVMSFPADVRQQLLSTGTDAALNNLFHFTPFLLFADPQRFAVHAYRHFRAPGNGCDFLRTVVAQRVHFPPGTE